MWARHCGYCDWKPCLVRVLVLLGAEGGEGVGVEEGLQTLSGGGLLCLWDLNDTAAPRMYACARIPVIVCSRLSALRRLCVRVSCDCFAP